MGGGCACQSTIKNYFFGTSDFILSNENNVNNISIKNKSKIPEQNIRIIPKEDYENMNIVKNNKNKIKINKNNSSNNNSNIKLNNINEDNTKKLYIKNKNSSSFEEICSPISKKNNNKENHKNKIHNITHENKIINTTINNQNNAKKIMENDNNIKKADTNYNYNLGEHNFIFINISQGNSIMKNETSKFESATPQRENMEEITKGKKKLFSHFCKNKMNEKAGKNQSIINNLNLRQENIHIQLYMNDYSEEMLNFINSIRKNPESFIQYIDNDIIKNIQKTNEDIYITSKNIDEKIKLMEDYLLIFDKIKNILKEIIESKISENLKEFIYNKELEIVLDKSHDLIINRSHIQRSSISNDNDNNISNIISKNQLLKNKYSNLNLSDDKIANLILEKRKQIKEKYPEILFKLNIIKDIKINILILISIELFYNQYNDETMLKGIIFNPKYQYFAVSWANEINRNFISIACFA